jgi:hypothetical protein
MPVTGNGMVEESIHLLKVSTDSCRYRKKCSLNHQRGVGIMEIHVNAPARPVKTGLFG